MLTTDLEAFQPGVAVGRVALKIYRGSDTVTIDGQTFTVSEKQLLALRNGMYYRVFHTPQTKKILSIEPVPVGESGKPD